MNFHALDVIGVRVEMPSNQPIVLLKEIGGERFLPIWIGAVEATAIAFAQQGVTPPRPLTHDLMKDVLDSLQVAVDSIHVFFPKKTCHLLLKDFSYDFGIKMFYILEFGNLF